MAMGYRSVKGVATPRSCDVAANFYHRAAMKCTSSKQLNQSLLSAIDEYHQFPPGGPYQSYVKLRLPEYEEGGLYGPGGVSASL